MEILVVWNCCKEKARHEPATKVFMAKEMDTATFDTNYLPDWHLVSGSLDDHDYASCLLCDCKIFCSYYFKDLSIALGQTNRISLPLASWMPIFAIGLFSSIGILQINEK